MGRLNLIQSVLSGILLYFLFLSKMPASVSKDIERLTRSFLLEEAYLVNREVVLNPLESWGLFIRNMQLHNDGLMVKWLWCFHLELDFL